MIEVMLLGVIVAFTIFAILQGIWLIEDFIKHCKSKNL